MDVRGSPQAPQGLLGVAGIGGSSPRGQGVEGVFGGWVSCMVLLPKEGRRPVWCGGARGRQARARRGLYKLCLKRMQKVLLPMCKIETRVCGLSSGLLLLCRCAGMSSRDAGSGETEQGAVRDDSGMGSPQTPLHCQPLLPDQEIAGSGGSGSQGQGDGDTDQEGC